MSEVTNGIQVLGQGFGYGIVVGIGAFFALLMYVSPPFLRLIPDEIRLEILDLHSTGLP
jgi:hypothetical protein